MLSTPLSDWEPTSHVFWPHTYIHIYIHTYIHTHIHAVHIEHFKCVPFKYTITLSTTPSLPEPESFPREGFKWWWHHTSQCEVGGVLQGSPIQYLHHSVVILGWLWWVLLAWRCWCYMVIKCVCMYSGMQDSFYQGNLCGGWLSGGQSSPSVQCSNEFESVETCYFVRGRGKVSKQFFWSTSTYCFFLLQEYNSMCVHATSFTLEPNVVKTFPFSFSALASSVGDKIEVG